jgi:hypothetical protein
MNVRGIFPSLGAGGSLIAAVLCAAAVLGGVLAFRGGDAASAEANAGDVTVPSRTVRARTSSSGLVKSVLALATVGRETTRPAAARSRTRRAAVRPRAATPPRTRIAPRAPAPAVSAPSAAFSPPPTPRPSPPLTDQVTGTAERTVEQVRAVAQPVVDAVPQPTQHRANSVTDAVQQVAGTVDQTVDDVTGGLLP